MSKVILSVYGITIHNIGPFNTATSKHGFADFFKFKSETSVEFEPIDFVENDNDVTEMLSAFGKAGLSFKVKQIDQIRNRKTIQDVSEELKEQTRSVKVEAQH